MTAAIDRRLSRLEDRSPWGSKADLAAASSWVMRIPQGGEADRRVTDARQQAFRSGKHLTLTSLPAAVALPVWRPVPLEKIPDALLYESIDELYRLITEAPSFNPDDPAHAQVINLYEEHYRKVAA